LALNQGFFCFFLLPEIVYFKINYCTGREAKVV